MTPKEFFIATMNMRCWQQTYFRTRSRTALNESRKWEKVIDAEVKRVKDLFPNDKDLNPILPQTPTLPL